MKKSWVILLTLIAIAIMSICCFAEDDILLISARPIYDDIEGSNYKSQILMLSELGIFNGYGDGTFKPEASVTRAEIAKLFVIVEGKDIKYIREPESKFNDVPQSHWANYYICCATDSGLIEGDGDGNFRPDDNVKYTEIFTMMARVLGREKEIIKSLYWPENYIELALSLRFDKRLDIKDYNSYAIREHVAQLIYNVLVIPNSEGKTIAEKRYFIIAEDDLNLKWEYYNGNIEYNEKMEKGYITKELLEDYYIIICSGMKNTGGYNIEIDGIEINENDITINAVDKGPKEGSMVTMAITYPSLVLKLNRKPDNIILNWVK